MLNSKLRRCEKTYDEMIKLKMKMNLTHQEAVSSENRRLIYYTLQRRLSINNIQILGINLGFQKFVHPLNLIQEQKTS